MSLDRVTIFYSWQRDLPNRTNRGLIEDALEGALKELPKFGGEKLNLSAALDRDTAGRSGSPEIVQVIFEKIDAADAFVCDVSIINKPWWRRGRYRLVPNPNVLTELGYAAKKMGWDRIVCLCNEAFGKVEDLPFDLRGKRVIPYHLSPRGPKGDIRKTLTRRLIEELKPMVEAAWADHRPHPIRFAAYLDVAAVANRFLELLGAAHSYTTLGSAKPFDEVLTPAVFEEVAQYLWLDAKSKDGVPVWLLLCRGAKDFSEAGEKILNRYGLDLDAEAYGAIHTALDSAFLNCLQLLEKWHASDSAQGNTRPALLPYWAIVEDRALEALRRLHLWCKAERQNLSAYDGEIRALHEIVQQPEIGRWRISEEELKMQPSGFLMVDKHLPPR